MLENIQKKYITKLLKLPVSFQNKASINNVQMRMVDENNYY